MTYDTYQGNQYVQVNSPGDNHPHWDTLNNTGQRYFCGNDAAIYFEDLYIAEIVNLQYEMQEALYPLRPYGSFKKVGTLHGARQVQGTFTINFQQTLLFWLMLEHIRGLQDPPSKSDRTLSPNASIQVNPNGPYQSGKTILSRPSSVLVPEAVTQLREVLSIDPGSHPEKTLAQVAKRVQSGSVASIRDKASQLQTRYNWQSPKQVAPSGPGATLLQAVYNSITVRDFQSLFDTPNGFTIGILLGDVDREEYQTIYDEPEAASGPMNYDDSYLKISEKIDSSDYTAALSELPPWSVLKITGVEISGCGQVIDDSGRALLQTYSFIADEVI